MTDWAAAACLLFFSVRGYLKGFIPALFGVLSLIVGYAAMYLFSSPLGDSLVARELLPKFLAYSAAGMMLFFAAQVVTLGLSRALSRRVAPMIEAGRMRSIYWYAGGAVGALSGTCAAFLLVWGVLLFRAVRTQIDPAGARRAPATFSERLTTRALRKATDFISDNKDLRDQPLASAVLRVVSDPDEGIRDLRKKVRERLPSGNLEDIHTPGVAAPAAAQRLLSDEQFKERLSTAIQRLPEEDFSENPKFQKLLKKNQ